MLRLIALTAFVFVLFLICFPVNAGMVARDDRGNVARLREAPCKVHAWLKNFYEAEVVYNGKTYAACCGRIGSVILVIDEAGDLSPIPISAFEKELEI